MAKTESVARLKELQSRNQVLKGIARGEMAIRDGRVLTHAQAKIKMKRWLK